MSFSIWLPLILVLVLLALRIPVSMAFLSSAIFYFTCIATEMPLNMILSKMVSAGMNMNLMAIPFFITAGLRPEGPVLLRHGYAEHGGLLRLPRHHEPHPLCGGGPGPGG